jgi:predicted DNA-binding protein
MAVLQYCHMPKVTFSLDVETVETLRALARRTGKPRSLVVREAIAQHAAQDQRLSEADRDRLLEVIHRIRRRPSSRSPAAVDAELAEIRRSRRAAARSER